MIDLKLSLKRNRAYAAEETRQTYVFCKRIKNNIVALLVVRVGTMHDFKPSVFVCACACVYVGLARFI